MSGDLADFSAFAGEISDWETIAAGRFLAVANIAKQNLIGANPKLTTVTKSVITKLELKKR